MVCMENIANNMSTSDLMFEMLLNLTKSPSGLELIRSYPDIVSLVTKLFGDEGLAYLRETFTDDITYSISTQDLLELFGAETGMVKQYPEGGMSEFVTRMMNNATANQAQIWRGEPVLSISTLPNKKFRVVTKSLVINSTKIVCSMYPVAFNDVSGNVVDTLKATPQFQAIKPIEVSLIDLTVNMQKIHQINVYLRLK